MEDDSPGNGQVGALDEHPLGLEKADQRVSDAGFEEPLRQQLHTLPTVRCDHSRLLSMLSRG